jgi:hypothetical protein
VLVALLLLLRRARAPTPPLLGAHAAGAVVTLHARATAALRAEAAAADGMLTAPAFRGAHLAAGGVAALLSPLEPLPLLSDARSSLAAVHTLLACEPGCMARVVRDVGVAVRAAVGGGQGDAGGDTAAAVAVARCGVVVALLRTAVLAGAWRETGVQAALADLRAQLAAGGGGELHGAAPGIRDAVASVLDAAAAVVA